MVYLDVSGKEMELGVGEEIRSLSSGGFEYYHVTDHGRVFTTHPKRYTPFKLNGMAMQLSPLSHSLGYVYVTMQHDTGRRLKPYVHRLVCHAFIGPIPSGMEVDHIDHDRSNNNISNLRYLSHKENQGRIRPRVLSMSQIEEICRLYTPKRSRWCKVEWGQKELSAKFGVHQTVISHVLRKYRRRV